MWIVDIKDRIGFYYVDQAWTGLDIDLERNT